MSNAAIIKPKTLWTLICTKGTEKGKYRQNPHTAPIVWDPQIFSTRKAARREARSFNERYGNLCKVKVVKLTPSFS